MLRFPALKVVRLASTRWIRPKLKPIGTVAKECLGHLGCSPLAPVAGLGNALGEEQNPESLVFHVGAEQEIPLGIWIIWQGFPYPLMKFIRVVQSLPERRRPGKVGLTEERLHLLSSPKLLCPFRANSG